MKTIFKIITIIFLLSPTIAKADNSAPLSDNPFFDLKSLNNKKENPLLDFAAIEDASAEEIQSLIDQGYDINEVHYRGYNLLSKMILRGRDDIVALLIKAGVDTRVIKVRSREYSLRRAAFDNHPAIAQILIDAGADIDAKTDYGSTPLHIAASQGSIDVMRILLQAGADPNARNKNGSTAFRGAVAHAFIPDYDEGKEFYEDYTAEDFAREKARSKQSLIDSLTMLKLLIEYRADPHAVDNDGNNARDSLYYAQPAPNVKKYLDELGVK